MPIPKRIYQTWKTKNLPWGIKNVITNMMELNPSYSHYLYDDDEIDKFVLENYPGEIAECFNKLNIGASRADLWRYLILYKYGGVYLDIDAAILKPLDTLIRRDDTAIITREIFEGLFNQWILIFKKGHLLLKEIISQCVHNIKNKSSNNILHLTGSTVITGIINKFLSSPKLYINVWNTSDDILEQEFNNDDCEYKCRFYGVDMGEYATYHSQYYEQLYINNIQWEEEQKISSIFKGEIKKIGEEIDIVEIE
jgi:mannosyltransferase OCH1-like enzyme